MVILILHTDVSIRACHYLLAAITDHKQTEGAWLDTVAKHR